MTRRAGIGDVILIGHPRRDEAERMSVNIFARYSLGLDFRHMAGHAVASSASVAMMRMLFQRRFVRAIRRCRAMTFKTKLVPRLAQLSPILGSVRIMA